VREAFGAEAPVLTGRYAAIDRFLREIGNTLRAELRMRRTLSETYLKSLAGVIAIHLAGNYARVRVTAQRCAGLVPHKLNRVQAFIAQHYSEAIHVQELAASIHLSPFHFARMFKQATGLPPHLYITMQRMQQAKELLKISDLPLVDVAASVGFQSQGHFTGVFHKYAGVTPRIFRLNYRAARRQAADSVSQHESAGTAGF
jgi:AraC family transcriptional regulator